MSTQTIELQAIRLDGGTQPRTEIDTALVSEYAQAMRGGAVFPPVIIYFDGVAYWLADGFHRYHAAASNGLDLISAYVRPGTQRDAVLCSVGANAAHGARRTNADKRKAVMTLLDDAEWKLWSDTEISRRCGVAHTLVGDCRRGVANRNKAGSPVQCTSEPEPRTYTTKHGTVAQMQTENIGQKRSVKRELIVQRLREGKGYEEICAELACSANLIAEVKREIGLMGGADKSREAVEWRRAELRRMAGEGYSTPQIAAALDIDERTVAGIAKSIGVEISRATAKTARHDSNRILEHIVMDAENLTADTGLVTFSALDRARLPAWIDSLVQSRRSLDALIKVLKEQQHGEAA